VSGEQIGLWAGFIFTLMIFSYVLGDNFLYRIALYIFIGLAAGYISVVTVESVLLPWIRGTILNSDGNSARTALGLIPIILGLLLLLKTSPRLGRIGNIGIAFIIGVGTAVSLVGAITGTLLPLTAATGSSVRLGLLNGFLMFIGVACTLVYFQYLGRRRADGVVQRNLLTRTMSAVGQAVIIITLGALYAGAILSSLTVFSERVSFLLARISGG
jgi:hypothetical protein